MTTSKTKYSTKYVSPFAKKMNSLAIRVLIFAAISALPFIWSSIGKLATPAFIASRAIEITVWLYLAAILFQFHRRTQLREYLLHAHTYWLAGVIAYPITYLLSGILLLIRNIMPTNLYSFFGFAISASWFVLAMAGKTLSKRRTERLEIETQNNIKIWKQLINMDLKGIALLQFPISS